MTIKRGADHYAWKGDAASDVHKRRRVTNPRIWGPCELCGAKGVDRHHRDGNPGNNVPENLQVLCRRCHMTVDGRLERVRAMHPGSKPARPCVNCKRLYKPLRHSRCHACDMYFRRNGFERPIELAAAESTSTPGALGGHARPGAAA